jgi:hypothetical protein
LEVCPFASEEDTSLGDALFDSGVSIVVEELFSKA